VTTDYICTHVHMYRNYLGGVYCISMPQLLSSIPIIVHPSGCPCSDWATGLDERGETIISEFRGTGFAGSAVRDGSRTGRGTVVSREWWSYLFLIEFLIYGGRGGKEG
jgi:hypothetical protein